MTDKYERQCAECGRLSAEFDFDYEEIAEGCVGRVYYCRDCYGEETWQDLAQCPELGAGLFVGRSTRIAPDEGAPST
jgi:hypothetical protein